MTPYITTLQTPPASRISSRFFSQTTQQTSPIHEQSTLESRINELSSFLQNLVICPKQKKGPLVFAARRLFHVPPNACNTEGETRRFLHECLCREENVKMQRTFDELTHQIQTRSSGISSKTLSEPAVASFHQNIAELKALQGKNTFPLLEFPPEVKEHVLMFISNPQTQCAVAQTNRSHLQRYARIQKINCLSVIEHLKKLLQLVLASSESSSESVHSVLLQAASLLKDFEDQITGESETLFPHPQNLYSLRCELVSCLRLLDEEYLKSMQNILDIHNKMQSEPTGATKSLLAHLFSLARIEKAGSQVSDELLVSTCQEVAAKKDFPTALSLKDRIHADELKDEMIKEIAVCFAQEDDDNRACSLASTITNPRRHESALQAITVALIQRGNIRRAETLLDESNGMNVNPAIVSELANEGHFYEIDTHYVQRLENSSEQDQANYAIAIAMSKVGLFTEASPFAEKIQYQAQKEYAYLGMIREMTIAGEGMSLAAALFKKIQNREIRRSALVTMIQEMTRAGNEGDLQAFVNRFIDEEDLGAARLAQAQILAEEGKEGREKAFSIVAEAADSFQKWETIDVLCKQMVQAGEVTQARDLLSECIKVSSLLHLVKPICQTLALTREFHWSVALACSCLSAKDLGLFLKELVIECLKRDDLVKARTAAHFVPSNKDSFEMGILIEMKRQFGSL